MEYNNTFYGDAYCVHCKDKITFEGQVKTSDSGRRMAMGKCPQCGTRVNRILGKQPNVGVPPLPQPAVPMPPQYRTYATVDIWRGDWGIWNARVVDQRRATEHTKEFIALSRRKAVRVVERWLNDWSRKEYKERI